ncbi:hypothetical protein BCE02nite_28640 [Brevibacillus centrosporus]|uniref:helix-turn-helix domain-containing protein n=2 Tax=Brevibacillus centrosporus TaxID=54910 RepID=UPI00116DC123|nr:hypothetical protein BCE02nite_28640 [Brevibacillus centrosporus]
MRSNRMNVPTGFWAGLQRLGIDPYDVVRKARLPITILTEPTAVTISQYYSVWEVAFLIGYEDQNSFYRAFRLWEGDTPSNWRSAYFGSNPSC